MHRIVVVDEEDHVIGMISLSDILSYLALRPLKLERKDVKINEEKAEVDADVVFQVQ